MGVVGRGSVIGLSRERRGARDLHPLCLHSYIKFPIGNHQPYFVVTNGVLELCVCLFCFVGFHEQIVCVSWAAFFVAMNCLFYCFSWADSSPSVIVLVLQFCYEILYQILSSKGQHEPEWLVFMSKTFMIVLKIRY